MAFKIAVAALVIMSISALWCGWVFGNLADENQPTGLAGKLVWPLVALCAFGWSGIFVWAASNAARAKKLMKAQSA